MAFTWLDRTGRHKLKPLQAMRYLIADNAFIHLHLQVDVPYCTERVSIKRYEKRYDFLDVICF